MGYTKRTLAIKFIYNFITLYLPGLLLLVCWVALYYWLNHPGQVGPPKLAVASLGAAGLLVALRIYATHIEPEILALRVVEIRTPKLRAPVRLLHASDFESARVGRHERKAVARMQELRPDLLIITGDLLQPLAPATYGSELPRMDALIRSLQPPLGKFYVLGEADVKEAPCRALREGLGGLHTLADEEALVILPTGRLRILGLSLEHSWGRGDVREVVERWLARAGAQDLTILAGHRPEFILAVQELAIDLCLAGHTHGGQVRFPFFGPPIIACAIPRRWARGCHEVGRTRLNVSAGIGSENSLHLPSIRLNCPSEMTLIRLLPAS